MAAALAPCAPGSSFVTLSFSSPPKQLTVDRAVLWHASTVLRPMFEDTCSGSGGDSRKGGGGGGCSPVVLQLSGDRPEDWEVALRLLHTSGEALDLVTWDNVVPLCRLADKYDIAHLRSYCAWFLSSNVSKLTLTAPLASPQNLLHAASLVERYLHQLCNVWAHQSVAPARQLTKLVVSAEYPDIVAPELQKRMHAAVVAALASVLTYCSI